MRLFCCLIVAVALGGCAEKELSVVDATLDGTHEGSPLKATFHTHDEVGGLNSVGGPNGSKDANLLIILSSIRSTLKIDAMPGGKDFDAVEVQILGLPPPPLRAGEVHPESFTIAITKNTDDFFGKAGPSLVGGPDLMLVYERAEFTDDPKTPMIMHGHVNGTVGTDVKISGTFQFAANCKYAQYYRVCGNNREQNDSDQVKALFKHEYKANDCPAAITDLFAEPLTFGTRSLQAKGTSFTCTDHNVFCHAEVKDVMADGCRWHVQAITDGYVEQFEVAGWVDGDCERPQKFCNAWR